MECSFPIGDINTRLAVIQAVFRRENAQHMAYWRSHSVAGDIPKAEGVLRSHPASRLPKCCGVWQVNGRYANFGLEEIPANKWRRILIVHSLQSSTRGMCSLDSGKRQTTAPKGRRSTISGTSSRTSVELSALWSGSASCRHHFVEICWARNFV